MRRKGPEIHDYEATFTVTITVTGTTRFHAVEHALNDARLLGEKYPVWANATLTRVKRKKD